MKMSIFAKILWVILLKNQKNMKMSTFAKIL